jgi:putative spermidine/putrescine transport system permease protein
MMGTSALNFARRAFAVVFSIYMLAPLGVVLLASLTSADYVQFPPVSLGLRWYGEVFQNRNLMNGLLFSVQIAAAVAVISGVLGVAAAFAISRGRFPGRDAIVALLTMPLAVPHVVLALALLQVFAIVQIQTSPWGLLAGHILVTLPYVLRLTLTSLHDLDHQIERASFSLGATHWETFRMVTLPIIAPGVLAGLLFAFLLSFDEVTISIFLSTPGRTTLPAEIFAIASQGSDPVITAASGLLILVATALVLLVERYFGVLRLLAGGKA